MDATRRGFLRSAGLTGLGAGTVSAGAIFADAAEAHAATAGVSGTAIAFHGAHQAGIATPAQ